MSQKTEIQEDKKENEEIKISSKKNNDVGVKNQMGSEKKEKEEKETKFVKSESSKSFIDLPVRKARSCVNIMKSDVHQIYALMLKNAALHWRQYISNVCQIATPIICVMFIFGLQLLVNYIFSLLPIFEVSDAEKEGSKVEGIEQEFAQSLMMISFLPGMGDSIPSTIAYSLHDNETMTDIVQSIPPSMTYSWEYFDDRKDINRELYSIMEGIEANDSLTNDYFGSFKIDKYSHGLHDMEFTLQYEKEEEGGSRFAFFRGGGSQFCTLVSIQGATKTLISNGERSNGTSIVSCDQLIGTGMLNIFNSYFMKNQTDDYMDVVTKVSIMPYVEEPFSFELNIPDAMGQFFYPLIILLILPVILYTIVLDKESELKELMKLMGLRERNYIFATYCFELFVYGISCALFVIMGLVLGYRFFTLTSPVLLIIMFVGFGCSIVSTSFFLASFLSSSFLATIVGYVIVIFTPVVGTLLNQFLLLPGVYEWKFLFLIPIFPITDLVYYASDGCSNFACLGIETLWTNPDVMISIGMLYFNAVLYLVVGIYLTEVLPKKWGVRKHPLFFVDWMFKCCRKKKLKLKVREGEEEDVRELRELIQNGKISAEDSGIIVNGLVKQFGKGAGKKLAVKGIHFNVRKNECFGLLGPNGAGKTTSVNMLSGLIEQTNGSAVVNGHDIRWEMDYVHKSMGLCPQFTVYWGNLTPREHLLFYARLKGVSPFKENDHVNKILRTIGLLEGKEPNFFQSFLRFFFPGKRAKEMSGGQRRRLAIGISLCGNPSILLFDEPTTGLDPDVRREIWDVIIEQKKNKSIILTTHSMEEADALSDRIGIMSHGNLVCVGSSLRLKTKFGNGYIINIKHSNRKRAVDYVHKVLSFAQLSIVKEFGDSITFEARPKSDGKEKEIGNTGEKKVRVSRIFEEIEKNKHEHSIVDFEINQTTLEDVFLNVIKKDEEKLIQEMKAKKSFRKRRTMMKTDLDEGKFVKVENQEENVDKVEYFHKDSDSVELVDMTKGESPKKENKDGGKEEKKVIQKEIESKKDVSNVRVVSPEEVQLSGKDLSLESIEVPSIFMKILIHLKDIFFQTWYLLYKNIILSIRGWSVSLLQLISPALVVSLLFLLAYITTLVRDNYYIHPPVSAITNSSSVLFNCKSWNGVPCLDVVYTTNKNAFADAVMNDIIADYELIDGEDYLSFAYTNDLLDYVYNNPNTTQIAISFSNVTKVFAQNTTTYTLYYNNTGDIFNPTLAFKVLIDNYMIHKVHEYKGVSERKKDSIKVSVQGFPKLPDRRAQSGQSNVFSTTGPLFFSLSCMIIFLVSLYKIVDEKEKNLRTLLELFGLKKISYFMSWFILFLIFGVLATLVTMFFGYIFMLDIFVYCNPLFTFLLFFTFVIALIFLAFAFSPFFNTAKTALIVGFVILGITFILNFFLANGSIIMMLMDLKNLPEWAFVPYLFEIFYPPFNFAKMFSDISEKSLKVYDPETNTYVMNQGYSWEDFVETYETGGYTVQESYISILFLLANCCIFFLVFWYFDNVLPRPYKKRQMPWFFLLPSYWGIDKLLCNCNETVNENWCAKMNHELEAMDEDVRKEYDLTRDQSVTCAIRVANLKKTYPGFLRKGNKALKGIDWACEIGTCLGLLGDNGSGKSTSINCITGIVQQNHGDVKVHGVSVKNEIDTIRNILGITLQHNVLFPDLTAREHIQLFSQFRKMKWSKIPHEIFTRLNEVSLFDRRNDRSKTYSGGMKRRLMCSMGFIGDPKVILLDEPTTGLDPFSKREVWNLIKEKKKKCSLVLTSHSMEEADALSDKIVIIQKGKMLCVGDSLHLKTKYGAGYVLKFITFGTKEKEFEKFIHKAFPNASLFAKNASSYIFNIRHKHMKELITGMKMVEEEAEKGNGLLKDFGLSHTTLEDVFMKVTQKESREKKLAELKKMEEEGKEKVIVEDVLNGDIKKVHSVTEVEELNDSNV